MSASLFVGCMWEAPVSITASSSAGLGVTSGAEDAPERQ